MRRSTLAAGGFCFLLNAHGAAAQGSKAPDLATARVVDLTHAFDEKTIYWPNSPSAFELKSQAYGQTPGGWFYSSNSFCTPEHGGTHLDAPIHFAKDGLTARSRRARPTSNAATGGWIRASRATKVR